MTYILTMKPSARSRDGYEYGSGPIMLYEIEGLPRGQQISVRNIRPQGRLPVWEIGGHSTENPTEWTGSFKTAEEALAHIQSEIDIP